MAPEPLVHVVDDDAGVRDSLRVLLEAEGLRVATYASGGDLLARSADLAPGCVLMDVRMPELDGLAVQASLHERRADLPVIMMTGHGDIPLAVRAVRAGAVDFLEKPFPADILLASVRQALEEASRVAASGLERAAARRRLDALTAREREVLDRLNSGMSNKAVAGALGISPRTVEVHRARVMDKLGVHSLAEAVRITVTAGARTDARPH